MTAEAAVNDFRRRLLGFDAGAEAILPAAFPGDPGVLLCAAALHPYGRRRRTTRASGD